MPGAIVLGGKVERIPGFAIGDRGMHESFDLFEHGYILRLVGVDVIKVDNQSNNQDKEGERKQIDHVKPHMICSELAR
jgi:hypothetical protein